MAYSVNVYEGDNVTTSFAVNFTLDYLSKDHVFCYVEGEVDGLGDPIPRTLTWITDFLVDIGTAPATGLDITLRRITPKTSLIHDFQDGAVIAQKSFDESHLQAIMISHELFDGYGTLTFRDNADMLGFLINNLGDPVDAQDAVTKAYLEEAVPTLIGTIGADIFLQVNSLANLRLLDGTGGTGSALVLAHTTKGDGGTGIFNWDATSTETDNNGTIIKATAVTTGRWKRSNVDTQVFRLSYFGGNLESALTAIGSSDIKLIVDVPVTALTGNLTVADNVVLEWNKGCTLDGAFTLTLGSQDLIAGRYTLFGSSLTVTGLKKSYPEWWNIDGTADDVEIQKAIDATAGGVIDLDSVNGYTLTGGLTVSTQYTHLFAASINRSLLETASDIYMLTVDNCLNAKFTNIGLTCTHGTPTKANLLMAGKAKVARFDDFHSNGNKYGILFDGAQGSVPGAIFYNEFFKVWIAGCTDENIFFTAAAGMNENNFWGGLLSNVSTNKLIRTTGNNNKFIGTSLETVVAGNDWTQFAITDNGLNNTFSYCRLETDGHGILVNLANSDESLATRIAGNYWGCNGVRVAVRAGIARSDTAGKDSSYSGIIKDVTLGTTVDVESTSAQKVVSVASTTNLYEGCPVVLDEGNANEEWHLVASITPGVSFTTVDNLVNTHAVSVVVTACNSLSGIQMWQQADASKMQFFKQGVLALEVDSNPAPSQNRSSLLVFDKDQAAMHQVYIGVADSGGAGFRMLRIVN